MANERKYLKIQIQNTLKKKKVTEKQWHIKSTEQNLYYDRNIIKEQRFKKKNV